MSRYLRVRSHDSLLIQLIQEKRLDTCSLEKRLDTMDLALAPSIVAPLRRVWALWLLSSLGLFYGQSYKPGLARMPNTKPRVNSAQLPKTGQLRRPPNDQLRPREYLIPEEVDRLLAAAKKTVRHAHRNYTLILVAYRHGLRVGELIGLRWNQVDLQQAYLHVRRLKHGKPAVHPIPGGELRALRQLKREYPDSPFLFVSERGGGPLTDHAVRKLVTRLGEAAKFDFPVHPHQLRHACGFYLANQGYDLRAIQDYLGHKNIHHTVRYTELVPGRFDGFWKD